MQKDQRIEKIKYPVKRSRFKIRKFVRCGIKILSYKFFANISVTEKFAIFDYFIVKANTVKVLIFVNNREKIEMIKLTKRIFTFIQGNFFNV